MFLDDYISKVLSDYLSLLKEIFILNDAQKYLRKFVFYKKKLKSTASYIFIWFWPLNQF